MVVAMKTKTTNGTRPNSMTKVSVDYNVVNLSSVPAQKHSSKYDDVIDKASELKDNEAIKVETGNASPMSVRSSLYAYINKNKLALRVVVREGVVFLIKKTS